MRRLFALCLALGTSFVASTAATADAKDEVVVSVGSLKLTRAEVEQRIRAVPAFQLSAFGKTPEEIRKTFVDRVLVPELLFTEEAARRHVEATPAVAARVRDVLRQAMESELRDTAGEVTPDDVKNYYDENRHRFNTPRRIKLWRILLKDEGEAKKLIASLKSNDVGATTIWNKQARETSLDKATAMRDGDLGFVSPDGQTEMPQVRVDAALFNQADKVKDGEIVPEPVKEGDNWAVVWRRGNLDATNRTLAQEAPTIRQVLGRQKVSDAINQLATKLQQEQAKNVDYALLAYVHVDSSGDVGTRQRPGVIPRGRGPGPAGPQRDERGLR